MNKSNLLLFVFSLFLFLIGLVELTEREYPRNERKPAIIEEDNRDFFRND
jgi:hypothetical protein